jgi:hypothetical protein
MITTTFSDDNHYHNSLFGRSLSAQLSGFTCAREAFVMNAPNGATGYDISRAGASSASRC